MSSVAAVAVESAGLTEEERVAAGLCLGIRYGRAEFIQRAGILAKRLGFKNYCDPVSFVNSITSAAVGQVAVDTQIGGPAFAINTGDLSGIDAVGLTQQLLTSRGTGLIVTGAADSMIAIEIAAGPRRNKPPARTGAAVLVLEAILPDVPPTTRAGVSMTLYKPGVAAGKEVAAATRDLLALTLGQAATSWSEIAIVVGCNLQAASQRVLRRACGHRRIPVVILEEKIGYTAGASGAIASVVAIEALEEELVTNPVERRSALVLAVGQSGRLASLVFASHCDVGHSMHG